MNANTTSFASSASRQQNRDTSRSAEGAARNGRGTSEIEEGRLQAIPLVLAVLPLRAVVREERTPHRHD